MRYLLVILFWGLVSFKIGDESAELRSFGDAAMYDWHDCVNPPNDYIQQELPKIRKCFSPYVSNRDSFDKNLHFIDFNNDLQLDIIYAGTSGGEAECVTFLRKDKKGYAVLYEEFTNLKELEVINNRLIGYTILDLGCCAEYRKLETKYKINSDLSKTHIYTRATTNYTVFPKQYFNKPIPFIVALDTCKMRSSPFVDDTSMVIYDTISNVVSTYSKGATGFAWAEKKDNTGCDWWFVEMDPCKNQLNTKLNYFSDTLPMRNLGWMSSRYLKDKK